MIIPVNIDINKDKDLINWLKKKRNRSNFIRYILYNCMRQEGNNVSVPYCEDFITNMPSQILEKQRIPELNVIEVDNNTYQEKKSYLKTTETKEKQSDTFIANVINCLDALNAD